MKVIPNKALEFLLARGNLPILYWLKKDILDVPVDREFKNLCKYAARIRILESQRDDGSWCRRKAENPPRWEKAYSLLETLKNISKLYDYGCSQEEEHVQKAIKFLFSAQTREGDFRGFCLDEYAPTCQALTLEILCRYGLDRDKRVQKGFRWILKNRQNDGGWAIPYQTRDREQLENRYRVGLKSKTGPIQTDKSQPFSLHVTGMILRALAESATWRKSKEAWKAGEMVLACFFKIDHMDQRDHPFFWEEINYPFWATDILSSLDALSKIGFNPENVNIARALDWLMKNQNGQGFWEAANKKASLEDHLWVTMAVLRVLKRFGVLKI